ncbi:uncharacterized protein LOC129908114 [Episyrphus balteatus]|uniref:uncharacterized protein LOC129908114 n=1 Tax=Episyrphus balteatus TaxID=286459 RepID=UPI002485A3EE|nr:uncharacterized protein LOC129908114 [Episyrphus balteatus]
MVATSTTEAEIVAANEAAKETIWLKRLFKGIFELKDVPVIQVDNSAAVRLSQNPEFHRRTKHIAIKHFFIREKVIEGQIMVQQISTEHQLADVMTKPLPSHHRLKTLCHENGQISLWDIRKGKEINSVNDHTAGINDMQMNKDGTMFVTASKDTSAKLFDSESLMCLKTYKTERPVNSASISPIMDHVVLGGDHQWR